MPAYCTWPARAPDVLQPIAAVRPPSSVGAAGPCHATGHAFSLRMPCMRIPPGRLFPHGVVLPLFFRRTP